jgi:hypothetical protein
LHVTANCGNTLLPAGVLVHSVCKPLSLLSLTFIYVSACVAGVLIFLEGEEKYFEILSALEQAHSFASFGLCVGLCGLQMCVTEKGWHFIMS